MPPRAPHKAYFDSSEGGTVVPQVACKSLHAAAAKNANLLKTFRRRACEELVRQICVSVLGWGGTTGAPFAGGDHQGGTTRGADYSLKFRRCLAQKSLLK